MTLDHSPAPPPSLESWLPQLMREGSFEQGAAAAAAAIRLGGSDAWLNGEAAICALALEGHFDWCAGLAQLISAEGRSRSRDLAKALWICCGQSSFKADDCAGALLALGALPTRHRQIHACIASPAPDGCVDSLALAAWSAHPELLAQLAHAAFATSFSSSRASLSQAAAVADSCLAYVGERNPYAEPHRTCRDLAQSLLDGMPHGNALNDLLLSAAAQSRSLRMCLNSSNAEQRAKAPGRARPLAPSTPKPRRFP